MFEHAANQPDLIRSERPLTAGYTPAEPVNRGRELDRIVAAVRPLAHRREPENLLVYGPAGVGKTTLVTHVLRQLAAETRVATASINCWQYNTRPSLLTELLIQLGYPAPRKGKPVDELVSKLREWLAKHHGAVVVLDEVDQLADADEVLYDLHEVSEDGDHRLGLILISNQPPAEIELDPRSRSRIAYRPVEFRPYTTQDLVAILEARAGNAFRNGSVSPDALEEIAATIADRSGDCREALNLLLRAGRHAEQESTETVTRDHVQTISPQC